MWHWIGEGSFFASAVVAMIVGGTMQSVGWVLSRRPDFAARTLVRPGLRRLAHVGVYFGTFVLVLNLAAAMTSPADGAGNAVATAVAGAAIVWLGAGCWLTWWRLSGLRSGRQPQTPPALPTPH